MMYILLITTALVCSLADSFHMHRTIQKVKEITIEDKMKVAYKTCYVHKEDVVKFYTCCFKKLGCINKKGLYDEEVGADVLGAQCKLLTPKQVTQISRICKSVNEKQVSEEVRTALILRCVAKNVKSDICNLPPFVRAFVSFQLPT